MTNKKTLTFALMDAPFESARSATALKLIELAARRGYDIHVFAHDGAAYRPFEDENHVQIASLFDEAARNGGRIEWINCEPCTKGHDVRAAAEGVRRGTPADFWKRAALSDSTLVIGTRS